MSKQDDSLHNKLILSAVVHVVLLAGMFFGMPSLFKDTPLPQMWQPVPVEIVEIGAITNTRLKHQAKKKRAVTPAQEKKKEAEEKKAPKESVPQLKPAPKVEPVQKKTLEDALKTIKKMKKKEKEKVAQKERAPAQDPLASVLKNVAKLKPAEQAPSSFDAIKDKLEEADAREEAPGFGPVLSDRLTISAEDALRRQISGCWNMPIGARNPEELIVEVLITVNPDRTVEKADILDQSRFVSDPYFRAAAEAALRALKNPRCTPLELPENGYEQWKTIRFTFDPRDML